MQTRPMYQCYGEMLVNERKQKYILAGCQNIPCLQEIVEFWKSWIVTEREVW